MVLVTKLPADTEETFVLTAARARAFAQACGHDFDGSAPPMAVAIGTLVQGVQPVLQAALKDAGPDSLLRVMHREEAIEWHQPLRLDEPYTITPSLQQHEVRRAGTFITIAVAMHHSSGQLTVTSRSSLFVRAPGAKLAALTPQVTASSPTNSSVTHLDPFLVAADQPERYAEASLETNPIHTSDQVAQQAGLPKRILHGMCTLAYAARAVSSAQAERHPPEANRPMRLQALTARFVRPVFCHDTLTCRLHNTGQPGAVSFDVVQQDGVVVLSRGTAKFQKLNPMASAPVGPLPAQKASRSI